MNNHVNGNAGGDNPASVSVAFRLGMALHAMNNEGSEGANLMLPREIDLGGEVHDGISGDMIRRHIFENFVARCREAGDERLPLYPLSEMLHPDRGPFGIRHATREVYGDKAEVDASNIYASTRAAVQRDALLDVGGFFAPWAEAKVGIPEEVYIDRYCAPASTVDKKKPLTVKRDSCLSTAWAVGESEMEASTPIHASYRPTGENSLYNQTVRSGIYAGVIRIDLGRIGTDDYWCMQAGDNGGLAERQAISDEERTARQQALLHAVFDYLAAPAGARMAGFAPHTFLAEGAVLVSGRRNAPFCSPLGLAPDGNGGVKVERDEGYAARMADLAEGESGGWSAVFSDVGELLEAGDGAAEVIATTNASGAASE